MTSSSGSTVLEGTNIVDPRHTSHPITITRSMGTVTIREWYVKARDAVQPDTIIALLDDDIGEIIVSAHRAGTVTMVMHPVGTILEPEAILCYIRPLPSPAPRRPASSPKNTPPLLAKLQQQERPAPPSTPAAPESAGKAGVPEGGCERGDREGVAVDPVVPATSGEEPLPSVRRVEELPETLPIERRVPPVAATLPAQPEKGEPNTIGKKYRITPDQDRHISELAAALNRYPALRAEVRQHKVRDSELIRALIEWFAEQSLETQASVICANRQREREGKYGIGWPRPPRIAPR